jgi:signal transduction histidine kinase
MTKNTASSPEITKEEIASSSPFRIPIKVYFILMNLFLLCLLFPSVSYFFYSKAAAFRDIQLERAVSERTAALHEQATQLARTLSHSGSQAIAEYNFTFLNSLTEQAIAGDDALLACQFISTLHGYPATTGLGLTDMDIQEIFATNTKGNDEQKTPVTLENGKLPVTFADHDPTGAMDKALLLARAPIYVGGELWGYVYTAFTLKQLHHEIERYRQEWAGQMQKSKVFFLSVTGLFFLLGVIAAVLFTAPLVRTIETLRDGVERVAGGDLNHSIVFGRIIYAEFDSLAASFNSMTTNLFLSRKELDDYSRSLEERVEKRTRELQTAQADLVNQAHEAGMAEMAVGILHNIGNAITPAKVGAELLIKQLQTSRLRISLGHALTPLPILIKQASELSDKDKKYLLDVIHLLPGSLTEEYDRIIGELERINDKHHYIENIISLQMHYAKFQGSQSLVDANQITRDALKLLAEGLNQHQIRVELNLMPVAKVRIEESKLLQILINLIKNSYEAMTETPAGQRIIRIASHDENDTVVLEVTDNGCGFTEEEQKKMFNFGYSSKERGSGFGLHSCANYLIANNGSIESYSEGPGRGARFAIRLPAEKKEKESES